MRINRHGVRTRLCSYASDQRFDMLVGASREEIDFWFDLGDDDEDDDGHEKPVKV